MISFSKPNFIVKANGNYSFKQLQKELIKANQFIPIGPFEVDYKIEEIINHNLIGRYVDYFGHAKDWVINVALNSKMIHYTLGADIVKNVSGYNLSRLVVGGRGEFGLINSATFRTLPLNKKPKVNGQILNGTRIVCLLENLEFISNYFKKNNYQIIVYNSIGVIDILENIEFHEIQKYILREFKLKNGIPYLDSKVRIENEELINRIKSNF